jgi:hypothetical protein
MLQIKDLAKHIENRLNSNSSGFTFKIHTDTGEYISATRSQYDYNTVLQIINGIATVTSVENSPTNDGTVISSMVVRCELVIPMRDTEEDVYQLTEDNPDGSANIINQYTYNVVKCIVDAIKNDASVQVSIPMQSLLIQATGGNAGGPVTCIGTNLVDSIGNGIMQ